MSTAEGEAFKRTLSKVRFAMPGMEFATEMIIKSGLYSASMSQVPITLHPDGLQATWSAPTYVSRWLRTLRLFLIFSPRWSFFDRDYCCLSSNSRIRIGSATNSHLWSKGHSHSASRSLFGLIGWRYTLSVFAKLFAAELMMHKPQPRESFSRKGSRIRI